MKMAISSLMCAGKQVDNVCEFRFCCTYVYNEVYYIRDCTCFGPLCIFCGQYGN